MPRRKKPAPDPGTPPPPAAAALADAQDGQIRGYAKCRLIYEQGKAVDYEYLDLDPQAQRLMGDRIATGGPRHSQAFQNHEASRQSMVDIYAKVVQERSPAHFTRFSDALGVWFHVGAYPTGDNTFLVAFTASLQLLWPRSLLGSILDHTPDVVFAKDLGGRFTYANDACAHYFGRSAEDLIGLTDAEAFPESAAEAMAEGDRRILSLRTTSTFEEAFETALGPRVFLTTKGPLYGPEGQVTGLFGISRDITDRRVAERGLREAEERLRYTLALSRTGAWDTDVRSGRTWRTPEHKAIFGDDLPLDRWPGFEAFIDRVDPEDQDWVRERIETARSRCQPWELECRIRRGDGAQRWIHIRGGVRLDPEGAPILISGLVQDITEYRQAQQIQAETDQLLQEALRQSSAAAWRLDLRTGQAKSVPGAEYLYGLEGPLTDWNMETILEHTLPEDRPIMAAAFQQALDGGSFRSVPVRFRRANDQTVRWLQGSGGVLRRSPEGDPIVLSGVIQDVTDHMQAEQALRREEALLRAALDQSHTAAWIMDLATGQVTTTPGTEHLYGYAQPLAGWNFSSFLDRVVPEDRPLMEAAFRRCVAEGRFPATAVRILRADTQEERWLQSLGSVLERDGEGRPVSLAGVIQDVTEQRRAEQARRKEEALLREALGQAHTAAWVMDLETGKVSTTPGTELIFGYDRPLADWTYQTFSDHVLPEDQPAVASALQLALAEHRSWSLEFRIRRFSDGDVRWVQSTGGILPSGTPGVPPSLYGVVHDITDRRLVQQEREALKHQLEQVQRMESMGRLAGGVAHDMNNLLAAIATLATLEQRHAADDGRMALVLDACRQGRDLVKGLLDFSRRELPEPERLDLNELVRQQVALLSRTTLSRVAVHLALAPEPLWVLGSRAGLSNVILNLWVNALDALAGKGTLSLRTRRASGREALLVVSDTGCGMSPEVQARAMEPFFTTKPPGKGSGIGLAVVYGTVLAHRGTITLKSRAGRGTRVEVRLPLVDHEHAPESARVVPEPVSTGHQRTLRVLVVDDDALVRRSLGLLLESLGHRVVQAGDGAAALHILRDAEVLDLVFLDYNMPGLNGLTTLKRLRRTHPDLPVVVVSGHLTDATRTALEAQGRTRIVPKPWSAEDLERSLAWSAGPEPGTAG